MSVSLSFPRRAAFTAGASLPRELRAHLTTGLRLAGQLGLLWVVLSAGGMLARALALPLPGNLAGMLLLLGLLWTGVIRLEWVHDLASILVRHLMLFFIPLAVGLMVWQNLLASSGLVIGASLLGSAVVGILAAGLAAQFIAAREGRSHAV